jgi:uncharacterized cupredoxin-like copper-binding protein
MKRAALSAVIILLGVTAAESGGKNAAGVAGKKAEVTRVIKVVMAESADGAMIFEPARIKVKKGETIRFAVINKGTVDHEFVLDGSEGMKKHKALMQKFPEMEHDDPNSVRLEPGTEGEVIWKFTTSGKFEFACLIPGHMEAGMSGPILVN